MYINSIIYIWKHVSLIHKQPTVCRSHGLTICIMFAEKQPFWCQTKTNQNYKPKPKNQSKLQKKHLSALPNCEGQDFLRKCKEEELQWGHNNCADYWQADLSSSLWNSGFSEEVQVRRVAVRAQLTICLLFLIVQLSFSKEVQGRIVAMRAQL